MHAPGWYAGAVVGKAVRYLHAPTLTQWGCDHAWETTSRLGEVRYPCSLACWHCGLKVRTEERMSVPWGEAELLAQVKALLPERQPVYSRDRRLTAFLLDALNGRPAPLGYYMHASLGCDAAKTETRAGRKGRHR